MSATHDQDPEKNADAAATAQLGDKLPVVMSSMADRIRASLILCPDR
jgi:hypothetical protein